MLWTILVRPPKCYNVLEIMLNWLSLPKLIRLCQEVSWSNYRPDLRLHNFTEPQVPSFGVTAEYPSIWSSTPEKAGYMDTHLSPANALRTRNTYMSYLSGVGYAATRLRGYAVVKTFSLPWNMLVWKKVATQLRGYAVVKTSPPPQNMLVRKEVATRLRGYAVTAQPRSHTFQDLFWSGGVFSS